MTISKVDMMEATRLTRQGRLEEAMAVLRGNLAGARAAGTAASSDTDLQNGAGGSASSLIDLVPPSIETGRSWTAPTFGDGSLAGERSNVGRKPTRMLGGLLDRLRKRDTTGPLDGLMRRGVTSAPTPLPAGARFEACSFTNDAGSRTYKLYVPSRYNGGALPLVVMLHGCTQSPDDFAAGTRMNEVAEEQMFLVAYPSQTASANPSKCWNWFNGSEQHRDRGEPSLIAGITHQIMREFPVEPERVYVAGLSAGGAAAAIMGATYPDLYAAIGVHSGLACGAARDMPSAFVAMRQGGEPLAVGARRGSERIVPTIVFHGDGDKTVNPVNSDQVIAQSRNATTLRTEISRGKASGGLSYTCTIHSNDTGRPLLEQWVLHGAGHAWSGGSAAGSYTEPRGPDASREMIRFFQQHTAQRDDDSRMRDRAAD